MLHGKSTEAQIDLQELEFTSVHVARPGSDLSREAGVFHTLKGLACRLEGSNNFHMFSHVFTCFP